MCLRQTWTKEMVLGKARLAKAAWRGSATKQN